MRRVPLGQWGRRGRAVWRGLLESGGRLGPRVRRVSRGSRVSREKWGRRVFRAQLGRLASRVPSVFPDRLVQMVLTVR